MEKAELKDILDFIMNRADENEFDVIVKAVQRRQKDRHIYSKLGGMNPERAAKKMSADIQERFGSSMESMRGTIRGFMTDLIRKEAPEIPEADLAALVEAFATEGMEKASATGHSSSLPPDALLTMIKQFIEYSTGQMKSSEQQFLWESMPRWQDEYWRSFPPQIKALVDGLLKGRIAAQEFWKAVYSILGL